MIIVQTDGGSFLLQLRPTGSLLLCQDLSLQEEPKETRNGRKGDEKYREDCEIVTIVLIFYKTLSTLQEEEKHRDIPLQHDDLAAGHDHHAAGSHPHDDNPGLL